MSDEVAKQFEDEKSADEVQPQGKSYTLLITMQPNGSMELTGPIGNDVLCYGMLEKARSHIQKLHLIQELQAQQKSAGGINGLLKRMNGG